MPLECSKTFGVGMVSRSSFAERPNCVCSEYLVCVRFGEFFDTPGAPKVGTC